LDDANLVKSQFGFLYSGLKIDAATKTNEEEEKEFIKTKEHNEVATTYMQQFWNCIAFVPVIFSAILSVIKGKGATFNSTSTKKVVSYFFWEIVVFFGKLSMIII
jgi:hypothetical protein